jgi:hypothetical protein
MSRYFGIGPRGLKIRLFTAMKVVVDNHPAYVSLMIVIQPYWRKKYVSKEH